MYQRLQKKNRRKKNTQKKANVMKIETNKTWHDDDGKRKVNTMREKGREK